MGRKYELSGIGYSKRREPFRTAAEARAIQHRNACIRGQSSTLRQDSDDASLIITNSQPKETAENVTELWLNFEYRLSIRRIWLQVRVVRMGNKFDFSQLAATPGRAQMFRHRPQRSGLDS